MFTVVPRHCLDEDTPVPDCPELPEERSIFIVWPFSGDYMATFQGQSSTVSLAPCPIWDF